MKFRTMLNLSDPRGYLELWEAAAHRKKTGYDGTFTSVCNRLHTYAPDVANQKTKSKSYREGLPRSNSLREVSSDNHLNDGRELQEASYDDFEIMDCPENHPLDSQEYIWLFPSFYNHRYANENETEVVFQLHLSSRKYKLTLPTFMTSHIVLFQKGGC